LNRGAAYLDKGWLDMALADFADALRLDRTNADLFEDIGLADADKGDKADAVTAYLSASSIYLDRKAYKAAIEEADKAIGVSPQDPEALNARCWARAVGDTGLDLAEADCLRSLAVKPNAGDVLDSLAFVRFRQGRFDEALNGFGAALIQNPKQAESLYMRGIVKLRLGDADGGQADVAAAQTQDSTLPARYANWGVTPGASQ
jgi:tetratricopeptide (TPR) repeat protein